MRGAAKREHSERPTLEQPSVPTPVPPAAQPCSLCSAPRAGDDSGFVSRGVKGQCCPCHLGGDKLLVGCFWEVFRAPRRVQGGLKPPAWINAALNRT